MQILDWDAPAQAWDWHIVAELLNELQICHHSKAQQEPTKVIIETTCRHVLACGGGSSGVRQRAAWGGGGDAVALCHDMIVIYMRIIFFCALRAHTWTKNSWVFFLCCRYNKVHTRGVWESLSDAHKQTHHLGYKTSFLQGENMWIIGAKKWTECMQKRRYTARINGNLGHSILECTVV